ncbi:spore cortex protein [Metabacillus crassostreae]|uniref:YhcN/YlaJ family sporulation lipoprotein n=1 Tax=Metabacillus crassostreae TaxID=929098 RepID=UPI00195BB927|nr:YhcN/YlaJ family sporulation lipoprotein [Metabacillus crassostreae]MBM7605770.1 spore cortex protein [Metabacillus crassostreae]
MINSKKASTLTAIALLTTSLTACNGNEGALNNGDNDNNTRPIGYYSNENTDVDNEGPITEMMDGMNDEDNYFRRVNDRYDNRNMSNPTVPLGDRDNGLVRDNRFSHGDANYHGHLNEVGYYNRGDGAVSDKVKNAVEKIDNVDDARVLVTDDNVIVAVDTHDRNDADMKEKITSEIRKMTKGRNVQVITDEGTFTRIRNIDNDIRNGGDREAIDTDVNDLMEDLGDAIQRPFNGER